MRRRLVAAIAAVAAFAVLLFALPLGMVLGRTFRDEEVLRLQRDTIAATREIDLGSDARDPVELPRGDDRIAVYDRRGRRVAGRGPVVADEAVRRTLRAGRPAEARAAGELLVAVPLLSDERMTGVVRAARDDSAAQTDIRQAWVLLAAVGAAVVGLAALAAWVLGRRLAAPLERVAVVASRLGDGDFSARAPRASIEEVDKVGRALDSTAVRLHDLVMRERAFTADASHQLRTPLAALRIELEAMELRGAPAPEVGAALAQVDRLQTTIDTLLTVARDVPRPRERTDVVGLLDELENGWRGRLAAASRPLRVHAPGAPIEVRASRAVLVEILNVLMDNAWRHGRGAVVVRARCSGGYVAVEVGDEGPGFELDPEDAFERRRTQGPGHGIGLALARALAHAEGGRLDVPQPGPGPVVRLLVPVAISESWAPEDARSPSGRPGRED